MNHKAHNDQNHKAHKDHKAIPVNFERFVAAGSFVPFVVPDFFVSFVPFVVP